VKAVLYSFTVIVAAFLVLVVSVGSALAHWRYRRN